MTLTLDAVYWVGSHSEEPLRIMFNPVVAEASGYLYLDAFDKDGTLVERYKLLDDDSGYTTSF